MTKKINAAHKVAFITGAARRIGAEIALFLHAQGFNVILHYHSSKKPALALCAKLNTLRKDSAITIQADLTQSKKFSTLINKSVAKWGRLDVLINNAAGFTATKMGNISEKDFAELIDTNLKAPLFLAQAAAPHLKKQKGCIINIGDIHGTRPMRNYAVYSISKAGLLMATQALARELSPAIRVNTISPGPTIWPEGKNTLTPALKSKIINRTLLNQHGDPLVVAKTVYFVITEAITMTGQNIQLDSGRTVLI